jgi:hypothetical protein
MQLILSILLYLNIISSPGTYTMGEIRQDVDNNHQQIETIKSDPAMLNNIIDGFRDRVNDITVLDDGQLKYNDDSSL